MADAEPYPQTAEELLKLAMRTADVNERGRLISLAAQRHMRDTAGDGAAQCDVFDLDLFKP